MKLSDFDYTLPKELIAQTPLKNRDESKLMVLDRKDQTIAHHHFYELPDLLDSNCILVLNESRVIPARLKFKLGNGQAEILLVKPLHNQTWECMVKPGDKFEKGAIFSIDDELAVTVDDVTADGLRHLNFQCDDLNEYLKKKGETPTPPYIKEKLTDPERYQTVYSKTEGSVAAPTAGLHFTDRVFEALRKKGIGIEFVTLHVGLGTFLPVKTEDITQHRLHSEWFTLDDGVCKRLNAAKQAGKKIVAVGTTSVRVLESSADRIGHLTPRSGETDIFIYPGYQWKFVDQLITNFHVPKSTLLMLVSALAGKDYILKAYEVAKQEGYRFFSFGDAMLIR